MGLKLRFCYLFLKTFQVIVSTYVYYVYTPIDVDLQEKLLDSSHASCERDWETLQQLTNATVDINLLPYFPSPLLRTLGITQTRSCIIQH